MSVTLEYTEMVFIAANAAILMVSLQPLDISARGKSFSRPPMSTTVSAMTGSRQSLASAMAALLTVLSVAALMTLSSDRPSQREKILKRNLRTFDWSICFLAGGSFARLTKIVTSCSRM